MRGIELPEIGSIRDKLLTRMFFMEETRQMEMVHVIGSLVVAAGGATENSVTNMNKILDNYRKSVCYGRWSNDLREQMLREKKSDEQILDMVSKLGSK